MMLVGSIIKASHTIQLSCIPTIKRSMVIADATTELNNFEQPFDEQNPVTQIFIDLQEMHDNLAHILQNDEEADIIITQLTQLIVAMLEAAAEISVIGLTSEPDSIPAELIKRSPPPPAEIATPITQQPIKKDTQTKQIILATITEIAANIATIISARKNPRVLAPTIASMLAGIVRIIATGGKHK